MQFEKIYLVGNGRIADDCLRVMAERKIPVSYVQVEEETFSFTEKLCERLAIPFLRFDRSTVKDFLLGLEERTLIFSVHNSYLFPKAVVEKENLTILNMHIAMLPLYRGMNAPTWEIYDQREEAGVTWHEVAASIDKGNIIVQRAFPIGPDDTAMKVLMQSFRTGVELFKEYLDAFLDASYEVREGETEHTRLYLNKELPNEGYLDLAWDFDKAYAFLRSMDYSGSRIMPLPRVIYGDAEYEISRYKKEVGDAEEASNPAEISLKGEELLLSWGNMSLRLTLRERAA